MDTPLRWAPVNCGVMDTQLGTNAMAKIILDYLRVLVWPLVILIVFISFQSELSGLTKRATSVEAGAGGISLKLNVTSTGGKGELKAHGAPEMWFDIQSIAKTHSECLVAAESALKSNDFKNGGINNGNTAYGYADGNVGTIWCIEGAKYVLFAVAGPASGVASKKVADLKANFIVKS